MKVLVPMMILFLAVNALILGGGLMRIESPEAKAMLSGYHAHFMAFFLLAFLFSLVLLRLHVHHTYWISFGYACATAVLLEVLQGFTGYRQFSWLDMIVGWAGAGFHLLIAHFMGKGVKYGED